MSNDDATRRRHGTPARRSTPTASFVLNGTPVSVYRRHPHLLAALREELDVTSPKDGCSPSGQCGCCTVLIDGKAVVSCQQPLDKVDGSSIVTLEGVDRVRARGVRQRLRRLWRPAVRVLHPRHRDARQGPDRQEGRRPHPRRDEAAPRRPPVPLHRLRQDARRDRGGAPRARSAHPQLAGTIGGGGAKYEASLLALGDRDYIDDIRVPGMLHAALRLTDHARADVTGIDPSAALAADGVVAVFTAADIPGELRVGLIHKDWPIMIPIGGRTSCAGDVLAIVVAETREQARAAVELVEVAYDVLPPVTDPVAALADGSPLSVWGTDVEHALGQRLPARRRRSTQLLAASAFTVHETFRTQRIEHAFLEPESTLAVPSGDGRRAHPARVLRRAGRVGRPQRHRRRARRRPRPGHGRAGVERRRLRRQGGHGQPGPDGAGGVAARPAGEVHAVARGELPDPPQAPPDHARVPGGLRRRRAADRACACAASATPAPTPASA